MGKKNTNDVTDRGTDRQTGDPTACLCEVPIVIGPPSLLSSDYGQAVCPTGNKNSLYKWHPNWPQFTNGEFEQFVPTVNSSHVPRIKQTRRISRPAESQVLI